MSHQINDDNHRTPYVSGNDAPSRKAYAAVHGDLRLDNGQSSVLGDGIASSSNQIVEPISLWRLHLWTV